MSVNRHQQGSGWLGTAFWLALAVILCLAVWPLNRAPLFYIDTAAYLAQGDEMLRSIGRVLERLLPSEAIGPGGAQGEGDDVVVGSRSATYGLFLSLAEWTVGIGAAAIAQSLLFVFTVWLSLRVTCRAFGREDARRTARLTAFSIAAGCLGALPFYTIYLMPDLFTPVLILLTATLCLYGQSMRRWELAVAFLIGAAGVTAHPSNLLIGGLLLCGAALVALAVRTRRVWIGLVLTAAMLVVGLGERTLFTAAVETVRKAEVVYLPFLTVRVIVDGPGLSYLADVCPEAGLATCALYDKVKDAPERLHASKMMFSRAPEEGSFALLDQETQKRIAQEQGAFFANVVKTYPVGMALAVLNNAVTQAGTVSVIMSFPAEDTLGRMATIIDTVPEALQQARLTEFPDWLPALDRWHRAVYWVSGLAVAALLLWPWGGPPLRVRAFAVIVLGGIAANALVCGGISQPAERYGARVIFLLPMMAVLLLAFTAWMPGAQPRRGRPPPPG